MTPKERFVAALERRPLTGRVPHFELVFFLTMETFGEVHPNHRNYYQWDQMRESERVLHRNDIADLYVAIAERFEHSAIFLQPVPGIVGDEDYFRIIDRIRETGQDRYFIMMHGDATYGIPDGNEMVEFSCRLIDEPDAVKREASEKVQRALEKGCRFRKHGGLNGHALCSDYCFNDNPFLSPDQFSEFVAPYLRELVQGYRSMEYYVIKHTDGNIMPILDQLVDAGPHALHSLDPQGGVDIAKLKKTIGDKVCLIGNVDCGLMDTGTDEAVAASARYALQHGMPGGGYIFSTSNCVYSGMQLRRYEQILDIWRHEGNLP
jgi:uroporphyrinogen decarboxylase